MKPSSLMLAILLVAAFQSLSQDSRSPKKISFKINISDSASEGVSGYLYDITDSSLKISQWPIRMRTHALTDNFKELDYSKLRDVTLRRSHGAGRGAWKGALIGALLGAIAGFIEGDDPPEYWFGFSAGEKALFYGGTAGAAGTGLGALIGGLAKRKYPIGGRKERFDAMKMDVLNKTYGYSPKKQG